MSKVLLPPTVLRTTQKKGHTMKGSRGNVPGRSVLPRSLSERDTDEYVVSLDDDDGGEDMGNLPPSIRSTLYDSEDLSGSRVSQDTVALAEEGLDPRWNSVIHRK